MSSFGCEYNSLKSWIESTLPIKTKITQIKLPISLLTCASCFELPSNINIVDIILFTGSRLAENVFFILLVASIWIIWMFKASTMSHCVCLQVTLFWRSYGIQFKVLNLFIYSSCFCHLKVYYYLYFLFFLCLFRFIFISLSNIIYVYIPAFLIRTSCPCFI